MSPPRNRCGDCSRCRGWPLKRDFGRIASDPVFHSYVWDAVGPQGLTYAYMAGTTVYGFPAGFRYFGNGYFLGVPVPVLIMFGLLFLGTIFAQGTVIGQQIYLLGANFEAARLSGIPVRRRLVLVYTLSGVMAGFAAVVFLARLNSAEADIGSSLTLPAMPAVLIGGTSLFGGIDLFSAPLWVRCSSPSS